MRELCGCGSGKETTEYGEIEFTYKGFHLVASKGGSECEDCSSCKKFTIMALDEYGDDLIVKTDELVIDWNFYLKEKNKRFSKVEWLDDILVALGILSVCSENNWEIAGGGMTNMGPSSYYFTRENDAREYARLKFSDTLWNWEIRHISKVIKKSDVINNK